MKKKKSVLIREMLNNGEANVNRVNESEFLHLLCKLNDVELVDNLEIKWLIKANINHFNTNKPLVIKNKLTGEEEKFVFYMSTTSQIKNNEGWFVREEQIQNINKVEWLLSAGKLFELEGKETAINKDVIARLSLAFTGAYKTNIIPNFIVVKDIEDVVKKNVRVFEDDELVDKDGFQITQTRFDGCGIASNEVFKRIAKELKIDYVPAWATIRGKMATKGLVTNVNFMDYFNDKYVADTETFKKIGNDFYIKDCFGVFQKVDNNSIIVNESMCKWSKWFKSMEEYNQLQKPEYKDITDVLYISKVGKEVAKKYTTTSYQLLNQLALTPQALKRVSQSNIDFYHRVCNFDKVAVLELLKLEANREIENAEDVEVKLVADKISTLLSISYEKFIIMNFVKRNIISMIERKIKEVMSGSLLVEGSFKVCVADTISFMDYVMNGKLTHNLKENELYVAGETGERMVGRFPIAAYSEITKETLVDNELLNKYCNYTNEMIIINQADITMVIKSGGDYDGDIFQVISNKDLINSVIPCERVFINTNDGKTAKMPYSWENRVYANTLVKGNLIGTLALAASTMGDKCQELGIVEAGKVLTFDEIRKRFNSDVETYEFMNNSIKLEDMSEDFVRSYMKSNFKAKEKDMFKLIELSMCAIDAPKTLVIPSTAGIKDMLEEYKLKPMFFRVLPGKNYSFNSCNNVNSVLSNQYRYLYYTLFRRFEGINNIKNYMGNNTFNEIMSKSLLFEVDKEKVEILKDIILDSYQRFNRDNNLMKAIDYVFDENGKIIIDIVDGKEVYREEARYSEEEKQKIYKNACLSAELTSIELLKENSVEDVAFVIADLILQDRRKICRFAFDFYFETIIRCLEETDLIVTQLVKDENGAYQGMFERYSLVEFKNENIGSKNAAKKSNEIERKLLNKVKLRMSLRNPDTLVLNEVVINGLEVELNGEKIGTLFGDSVVKAGVTTEEIQGKIKVSSFIKSPTGKSAEIVLGEAA
ncbi:RNA dependent RNA polymerase [Clostridium celatum]|uniref:RNA dependent RNA polymerase n=1 Tax=Clostridium celatum TaxID=36834 RepID=UPI00050A0035